MPATWLTVFSKPSSPNSRDLERDVRARLERYAKRSFTWVRLAVNPEHFEQFNISPLAPKKKDLRTKKFVAVWGRDCAEVEAIPATDLREMVRAAVESHIPAGAWARLQRRERKEREQWQEVMESFGQ
jgi:hypothetical protein